MRPKRGGRARRLACQIALGCLIGAATAAGTTLASAAPSAAADSCSAAKANVEGARFSSHYGARGDVYVNTEPTVDAYKNDLFVRSMVVIMDNKDFVEVGWLAHVYRTYPTVFAYWNNNGSTPSSPTFHGTLSYDNTYKFWTVNPPGGDPIFQFWFDGNTSPFEYSPTMGFGTAKPMGNSERHNWCQSLWAHFTNLNDYTTSGWETWDTWTYCVNTSVRNKYYMHKDSDTEFHVTGTGPDNLTCYSS